MVCLFRSKLLFDEKKRKKNQTAVRRPSLYVPPAAPPRSHTPCVTLSETEYTLYLEAVASRPISGGRSTLSANLKLKYLLRQLTSAHAHTRSKDLLLVHHTCLFGGGQWNCYVSCPGVGSLLLRTGVLQHRRVSLAGRTCMHFVHCGEDFYIHSLKIRSART